MQETSRLLDALSVRVGFSAGLRSLAAGTLAGALLLCVPAKAQETPSGVAARIESTFALVLGNTEELAIPLTRRALARRLVEEGEIQPLAYGAVEADEAAAPETTASLDGTAEAPAASPEIEEGSADVEEDPDVARLPRPRPAEAQTADAESAAPQPATLVAAAAVRPEQPETELAMGGPLDLVAGAAVPEAFAASELAQEVVASAPPLPIAPSGATDDLTAVAAAPAEPSATPLELVATGACLPPGEVTDKDGDFERNAEVLSENVFCIAEEKFKERRRTWTIATIRTSRPGPLFAVMHDDEDLSFDTAVAVLKTYGGTLVAVETGGKRNQDGVDPNRNFSADGIGCKKLGNDATPEYTGFFQKLFDPAYPIIALHNNSGERISTGGLGHVSMDDVPKDMEAKESANPDGPLAGERTLVLLTSPVPVTTNAEARAEELAGKGINAVVEPVREGKGDCSLSNYALLVGHPGYFNVTVDKGEEEKQRQIVDAILAKPSETAATPNETVATQ